MKTALRILTGILLALSLSLPGAAQEPSTQVPTYVQYRLPQALAGPNVQLTSSNFSGWTRYPAETREFVPMASATAYFRDVFVGGETYVSGAVDGDNWQASAVRPDGQTLNWTSITFYDTYNGNRSCFVSSAWTICGTTSLQILWYASSQCATTGEWTMTFSFRGTPFYSGRFKVLPEIPPDALPPVLNQLTYDPMIKYDSACKYPIKVPEREDPFLIGPCLIEFCWPPRGIPTVCTRLGFPLEMWEYGCYLMAATMQTTYHGAPLHPVEFDTWLRENRGYTARGSLKWESILDYANFLGLNMSYDRTVAKTDANGKPVQITDADPEFQEIGPALCRYGPQVIAVTRNNPNGTRFAHFLLVTGMTEDKRTYKVVDPWEGLQTTLDDPLYLNKFWDSRIMYGPEHTHITPSGIAIHFHSPGELLITDAQGRRAGLDPLTNTAYSEIPGAVYLYTAVGDISGNGPPIASKVLSLPEAVTGEYSLRVTGTGSGYYTLDLTTYGAQTSSQAIEDIPIEPGVVHTYAFEKNDTGGGLQLSGQFDGKGQRPADVNKLLTYIAPSEVTTSLAAGTAQYSLVVVYGDAITAGTFTADLNGANISSLFHPSPGGHEIVPVNLAQGRNVLRLSISGTPGGRTVTDTDRLVFVVP